MGGIFDLVGVFTDVGQADETPPRDLAAEIRAMIEQGPALLRSQQELAPGYTNLRLQNLSDMLRGTPAGTRTVINQVPTTAWRNLRTGEVSTTQPQGFGGDGLGGYDGYGNNKIPPGQPGAFNPNEWVQFQSLTDQSREIPIQATRGLLDLYSQDITPALTEAETRATTARRTANLGDLSTLGPGAVASMKALDPQSARLYEMLQADAAAGLAAGDRLTSDQQYLATNPVRSSFASRGFSPGAMEGLAEGINLFGAGNELGQQRRANASGVAQLGQNLYSSPALQWLSPGSTVQGAGQNLLNANSSTPGVMDQMGGYASGLFGGNYQGALNTNLQNANNAMQMWLTTGQQMTQDAATASSMFSSGMFCWAARTVFGADDPRWRQFRNWILQAPWDTDLRRLRFAAWYAQHGAEWAERLKRASAGTRAAVRRWMERRIAYHSQLTTPNPEVSHG